MRDWLCGRVIYLPITWFGVQSECVALGQLSSNTIFGKQCKPVPKHTKTELNIKEHINAHTVESVKRL